MSVMSTHLEPDTAIRAETHAVRLIAVACALFFIWAFVFPLTEVSSGSGTVVPSWVAMNDPSVAAVRGPEPV